MSDRPISFRVCDFSEQMIPADPRGGREYPFYSAVMHVDGEVFEWRKMLHPEFQPPIASLRTEGWLGLLHSLSKRKR
jgi:hypothetical protein